ncbi:cytochrome P450 [Penicillium lagena]|uniref:cytochrome P450 n=1 Tax=Penicillium lagena TaxID=94218 RepID=UPI0025402793|nr:cytochrome P450 [Penicillium lagena]KAJ5606270.1 cytochrome P450 [Penicillium lagena]
MFFVTNTSMGFLYGFYHISILWQLISFISWRIISRRHLHPLAHYPGPFFWTISRIPYATAYVRGHLHIRIQGLHDQYGDVVRVAPDELSYRNGQAWKDIHGHSRNFSKDMRFYHASKKKAPSVVVAPDDIHSRQKKAILRAFSEPALRSHEQILRPFVEILVQRLQNLGERKSDSFVDMTEWYNHVMFDFMSFELFGESLGCLESATNHPWVNMLFGSIKAWAVLSQGAYFPAFSWITYVAAILFYGDILRHRNKKFASVSSKLSEKKESESSQPTFSSYIRADKDPKSTLSAEEALSNHSFMMMAGSETTATLLSGCTFFILRSPRVYQKLSQEIRNSFSSPSEISFSSLADLAYLRAVLQETLRMYPPLPLGMPRVVPSGGSTVSGNFVPEKTSVAIASWVTYRSSSNFQEAQSFLPERWLGDSIGSHDISDAMQAFSIGPRACPGKRLAFAEASLILALMIWNFDLELSAECSNWIDQRAYIIWDKGPLWVKLTPSASEKLVSPSV